MVNSTTMSKLCGVLCTLVLGVVLAVGLLCALVPRVSVNAHALDAALEVDLSRAAARGQEPGPEGVILTAHADRASLREGPRSAGGESSSAVDGQPHAAGSINLAPPLPGIADLAVCMTTDRVWGVVGAGETVTVTVNGTQMGAARADGNGFFWTTLYGASGNRPGLGSGDIVSVYAEGVQEGSVTLRSIDGEIELLDDVVSGTIGGISSPISVTIYDLPSGEPVMLSYSRTVSTDGSGHFVTDFTDLLDLRAWDELAVAYVVGGIEVHRHVYPRAGLIVQAAPRNGVYGRTAPGTGVTATVYYSDMTEKESAVLTAGATDGWFSWGTSKDIAESDVVAVELEGGTVLSRTVGTLVITGVDAGADRITGEAEAGDVVCGQAANLTPLGWRSLRVTTTADAGGLYTLELSAVADIVPGRWVGVYVSDGEGDDQNEWAPPVSVHVDQTWDSVYGNAPAGPGTLSEGTPVTLTLYSAEADATFSYDRGLESYGWYWFGEEHGLPDIAPGDVVTVEVAGDPWQGVVHVMTVTTAYDVGADRFTGTVETPSDRVDLSAWQWRNWLYPVGGSFGALVTATSPFTADAVGFDVRNGVNYQVDHRTADGHIELIYREADWVEVEPPQNDLEAVLYPPGTAYTITLYDDMWSQKAQLTGTSNGPLGHIGEPGFWETGERIEAGDHVQVESAAGFNQIVEIPDLTVFGDADNDLVFGQGPANALLYFEVDNHGQGFVPTDGDGQFAFAVDQLQERWGDGDLRWGDWIGVWHLDENGNRVQNGFNWPQIIANYDVDGRSSVWGDSAIEGHTIYITVTHPLSGVVATGATTAGTCDWCGPRQYALDLPDGTIAPGNVVTVNWGAGYVDSTVVVEITANADVGDDLVTGTAPAGSWLYGNVCDDWNCMGLEQGVQANASGVYTMDFGSEGWDVYYGDRFNVHRPDDHRHETQYSFWVPAPDPWVEKQTTPGVAVPGRTYLYRIRYGNRGSGVAQNVVITDAPPAMLDYAADTGGFPVFDAGGVFTWSLGDLEPGAEGEFYVALDVGSGVFTETSVGPNCITITTSSPGDPDPGNDESCSGEAWADDGEWGLWVNKGVDPGDPHPGQLLYYHIDYGSDGGAATGPAWLTDTLPVSTTYVGWEEHYGWGALWTEVVTTGGQFVLYAPAGIPGDMGGHIQLALRLDDDVPIGTRLENTVEITTGGDVDPGNNLYVHSDARVGGARYDMQVDKWLNGGVLVPGGEIVYGIRYDNRGNVAVRAWLTDTLPDGASFGRAWRWTGHGDQPLTPVTVTDEYVVFDLGVLEAGEGSDLNLALDIDGTAVPGTALTNCATVGITETESTPLDNEACVDTVIYAGGKPNLYVSKQNQGYQPGNGQIDYWIDVRNYGDQTVYDVTITDTYPLSTSFGGNWWHDFWQNIDLTDNYTDGQLIWVLERLEPGWSTGIGFGVDVDAPQARMRWYTNAVEIDMPAGEANSMDNSDLDVVFSGGEVDQVEVSIQLDGSADMWGNAMPGSTVTVTTPYTQITTWTGDGCDTCWSVGSVGTLDPGDMITVEAGQGLMPVVTYVPDPFTAEADSSADTVYGQIGGWLDEQVEVHGEWPGGYQEVDTDGFGVYTATYGDIPRGAAGYVRFETEANYARVIWHRSFRSPDLILQVNYGHDWVDGNYEPGHTAWITVTESDRVTIKATNVVTTAARPGGDSGFSTSHSPWSSSQPDIMPHDWVYAAMDNGYTSTVQVGTITGYVDVAGDSISGTVSAGWILSDMVQVECQTWGAPGWAPNPQNKYDLVLPNGSDTYACAWNPTTEWDVEPGQNIGVFYQEPDGDWVGNVFWEPVPYLQVGKSCDGVPGEGSNHVFYVQYRNRGDVDAEGVMITDTMLYGMTYISDTSGLSHSGATGVPGDPIVWDLGIVAPGDWIEFEVYVEVTASASETITNAVEIASSSPYDQGDPGERYAEWSGVVQSNDTHLNVGKSAWTGDPAPDTDFIYAVNVCNTGSTGSSEVVVTDTLHPSTTLQSWWGQDAGWTEVSSSSDQLVVSLASIPGWRCSEVYLRVHLDAAASPGTYITNTAVISAGNDLEDGDNEAFWDGSANAPHANLYVEKQLEWGQLVPDGEIAYQINYGNNGNVPVGGVLITDTLPADTTFRESWRWTGYGEQPVTPLVITADYVVWDIGTLENGWNGNIGVALDVDDGASPGTVLTNSVEISPQPNEDRYDDNQDAVVETLLGSGPNLRVSKYHRWEGNTQIFYGIWIRNLGTTRMEDIWITDTYPVSTTSDGSLWIGHGPQFTHTHDGPNRQFTIWADQLDPGNTGHLGFWVDLDGALYDVQGLAFTNTVEAPWPGDIYADDNVDVEVAYTGPDVYVEKWLSGGEPRPGEIVTFTVEFGNRNVWPWDGDHGYGSHITDTLPPELEFITATMPWRPEEPWPPATVSDHTVAWEWGMMSSNWTWQFEVVARVTDTVEGGDVITNRVEAYGDSPTDVEPLWDNNAFDLPLTILAPKFEVGKVYESSRVAGTVVTYTLTVTNVGNEAGTNVVLSDTLPEHLTYSGSDGSFDGTDTITWTFANIAANGGTATCWFVATLPGTAGSSIVNDDYWVVGSDQGVASPVGSAVSFDVIAPTVVADFDQSATAVLVSQSVAFTDTSTTDGLPIVEWGWNFGDGETSAQQDTSHAYAQAGTYTVTLTVTDTLGYSDAHVKVNAVTVSLDCIALTSVTFDYAPSAPAIRAPVVFTATHAPLDATTPVTYSWSFGDGGTAIGTAAVVSHTYTISGTQTVRVTAYNLCTTPGAVFDEQSVLVDPIRVYLPVVLRE